MYYYLFKFDQGNSLPKKFLTQNLFFSGKNLKYNSKFEYLTSRIAIFNWSNIPTSSLHMVFFFIRLFYVLLDDVCNWNLELPSKNLILEWELNVLQKYGFYAQSF